jgi:hypothetical protein
LQAGLTVQADRLSSKMRRLVQEQGARGSVLTVAFDPMLSHILAEAKERIRLFFGVEDRMGVYRFRVNVGGGFGFFDVDRALVRGHGDRGTDAFASDGLEVLIATQVSVLLLEPVSMGGDSRLGSIDGADECEP